jgi:hypothetical protein
MHKCWKNSEIEFMPQTTHTHTHKIMHMHSHEITQDVTQAPYSAKDFNSLRIEQLNKVLI